ncbi:MAG: recombinase family protein [Clostridia bacterium]|nr:recombinase family protein [Clostridia bacterium]
MKTAVIYARYSSDNQTEQSIEGQLRVCQEFATRNDICVLDTYIDRAMTGTNDNRPAFLKMIKDSVCKEWDYVLVYKLDRFSRDKYETAIHKKELKDNGVKVLSATENIPDTPEGIIFESIIEGYAQYYSAELSHKVKRGMNETRLKGNYTGGTLIYGYKVVDHKVLIDEAKAEIVRFIFEEYAKDTYVKDIIAALTERGILNRGKPFAKNTIHNILKNEKYSGIYRYNDEVFTNIYPQIVPTVVYEKVRAKSERNIKGSRSPEEVYVLRGKLKCGYCGKPITAETGTAKNGKKIRYYKCSGRKSGSGCESKAIRKDTLENLIIEVITEAMTKKEKLNAFVDGAMKIQEENARIKTMIAVLTRQKVDLETSLDNIMKAVEKGVVTNTTTKRIQELEVKIEESERKILIEKSKTVVIISREEIEHYLKAALKSEPKLLLNTLIREVKMYNDRIEIYFNYSDKKSSDESRDFSFYKKNYIIEIANTCSLIPLIHEIEIEMYV